AIRPEQHAIVLLAVPAQVVDERRDLRAVLAKPVILLVGRCAPGKHEPAAVAEPVLVAPAFAREAQYADAPDRGFTGRIVIGPGDVIAGARGEDRDVVARGEVVGDEAAVGFGSAGDLGAEALN